MIIRSLFLCFLFVCGCHSSNGERTTQFLSAANQPPVPQVKPVTARLSSKQALDIAINLAKEHHEQLETYGSPQVTFYPQYQNWNVVFPDRVSPADMKNDTDRYIFVLIKDESGEATYDSFPPPSKAIPKDTRGTPHEFTNSLVTTNPDESLYKRAALELLIQEANQIAKQLKLKDILPITKTNLVESFILPLAGARSWKAIGTVETRNYAYCVSKANQFCFLEGTHQQEDMRRWRTEFFWPVSRLDTNAAYQLATQWLAAVGMDVENLNHDCRLHVDAAAPQGLDRRDARFVPLYTVYWVREGYEGRGSAASVHVFLPTKELVQLRVDDPKYNLRKPLQVTNLSELLMNSNTH